LIKQKFILLIKLKVLREIYEKMIELLKIYGYKPLKINPGKYGDLEITFNGTNYYLSVLGEQWMSYNIKTHEEVFDVFSHFYLAKGHCICTGLGFSLRETWLLNKKEVTKITVLEKSIDIINYHKSINSEFLNDPRVEVINIDANEYVGECDTLLLDHFELAETEDILNDVSKINKNIKCEKMWFWPLERIVMHKRKWSVNEKGLEWVQTKLESYNDIKLAYNLTNLPDLTEEELNMFCMMFNSKLFSRSEWFLFNVFNSLSPYGYFNEIYRNI
jgi:hypothetical protein